MKQILLIRHGKPTAAINPRLTAAGFAQWIHAYNQSNVSTQSPPPAQLQQQVKEAFIISSNLPRAIHSAQLCAGKAPDQIVHDLAEMQLPSYKLPFRLKAYHWLVLNRIIWLLGFNGNIESFKHARSRAKAVASQLDKLARQHNTLALFGHGLINRYVAKELQRLGWNTQNSSQSYWGYKQLQLPSQ